MPKVGVPKVGVSEEGVCFKIVFLCQDVKFKDPKFKHEIFVRIDMKHSYFSNYFIFCLQSFFSVVEIIIELFVCQKNLFMFMVLVI